MAKDKLRVVTFGGTGRRVSILVHAAVLCFLQKVLAGTGSFSSSGEPLACHIPAQGEQPPNCRDKQEQMGQLSPSEHSKELERVGTKGNTVEKSREQTGRAGCCRRHEEAQDEDSAAFLQVYNGNILEPSQRTALMGMQREV